MVRGKECEYDWFVPLHGEWVYAGNIFSGVIFVELGWRRDSDILTENSPCVFEMKFQVI